MILIRFFRLKSLFQSEIQFHLFYMQELLYVTLFDKFNVYNSLTLLCFYFSVTNLVDHVQHIFA